MMGLGAPSSRRSAALREKLAKIRGHRFGSRAARFRDRQRDRLEPSSVATPTVEPDFSAVAALPDWALLDDAAQTKIGLAAAILQARGAIDRELSGERLAAIAAVVGDALFEQLCDCELPDAWSGNGSRLPRPEDLPAIGAGLCHRAMPRGLRDPAIADPEAAAARTLCAAAAAVIAAAEQGQ
jgi:hypothetical protein